MYAAVWIAAAYLCGSLPTGVWVGHLAGIDVRRVGSGNIGATNVARTAGARAAIVTLLGDVAKGFLPALLARSLVASPWLMAAVAMAAVCGHVCSIFLRFSGGKGVATAFGAFLALTPFAVAVSAAIFVLTAITTRYASVASIVAAASLPVIVASTDSARPLVVAAVVVAVTIVARHAANIGRLRRGLEPKFRIGKLQRPG